MAAPSRASTLALYRSLLRTGSSFSNYNFRDYAVRSVRDRFRADASLADADAITAALTDARQNLELMKRQMVVSQMFPQGKHAMEEGAGGEEVVEGNRFPGDKSVA